MSGNRLWTLLREEPKELLPLHIRHWLLVYEDLWAVSQMAVQSVKDSKPILSKPTFSPCDLGHVYKSSDIEKIEPGRSVLLLRAELQRSHWM